MFRKVPFLKDKPACETLQAAFGRTSCCKTSVFWVGLLRGTESRERSEIKGSASEERLTPNG